MLINSECRSKVISNHRMSNGQNVFIFSFSKNVINTVFRLEVFVQLRMFIFISPAKIGGLIFVIIIIINNICSWLKRCLNYNRWCMVFEWCRDLIYCIYYFQASVQVKKWVNNRFQALLTISGNCDKLPNVRNYFVESSDIIDAKCYLKPVWSINN